MNVVNDARVDLADGFGRIKLLNERDTLRYIAGEIARVKHNLSIEEIKIAERIEEINIDLACSKIIRKHRALTRYARMSERKPIKRPDDCV
ncbi:MAG: hypothetical protein L0220_01415 [Acidobacteria bacterium]|nr:hypothetical protein [Acidobacteriota bacterium]